MFRQYLFSLFNDYVNVRKIGIVDKLYVGAKYINLKCNDTHYKIPNNLYET